MLEEDKNKMLRPIPRRKVYQSNEVNHQPFQLNRVSEPIEKIKNFIPFWNPEDYLRDLKTNGIDITILEKLYEENPPPIEVVRLEKESVKITNFEPIKKLYRKYSKPLRKPPIDERIKALHEAGYPEDVLLDVMKRDAKMNTEESKMDEFIFNIFGDIGNKKTAAVKKRTIVQILKIKKQTFVLPEPAEEIPNEDDSVYED
jgi:hypothetical protein